MPAETAGIRGSRGRSTVIGNAALNKLLEIDGEPLTEFSFSPDFTTGGSYWEDYQALPAKAVRLAEGKHVLRVQFDATPFNFGGLEFSAGAQGSAGK